jgi:alkylation response protein AidB-like acyl-CoA dehydrogenase
MTAVVELLREHIPAGQVSWLDAARDLGQGPFRERADMFDRENRFPMENYDDLHAAGLLGLMVPKAYGGAGADAVTYVGVLAEIAKGCASTGLTFNMHCAIIDFLSQIASEEQKQRYFGEIVEEGAILASITSEPASSFRDVFKVKTAIERDGDGYRLTGRKGWGSLSTAARYYFTWSRLRDSASIQEGLLNVMVPTAREGVSVVEDWDTVGMRATASNSIDFDRVRIEPDEVIGAPGILLTKDLSFWSLGYAAVYVGIAEAAFDYCAAYGREQLERFEPDSAQAVRVQRQVGEMSMILEGARRATSQLALLRGRLTPVELAYVLNQAKYLATEAAVSIAQAGMRMLGGSGLSRQRPMQQYLRDAQAGLVMPPANDRCIETVGRIALGVEAKTVAFS